MILLVRMYEYNTMKWNKTLFNYLKMNFRLTKDKQKEIKSV